MRLGKLLFLKKSKNWLLLAITGFSYPTFSNCTLPTQENYTSAAMEEFLNCNAESCTSQRSSEFNPYYGDEREVDGYEVDEFDETCYQTALSKYPNIVTLIGRMVSEELTQEYASETVCNQPAGSACQDPTLGCFKTYGDSALRLKSEDKLASSGFQFFTKAINESCANSSECATRHCKKPNVTATTGVCSELMLCRKAKRDELALGNIQCKDGLKKNSAGICKPEAESYKYGTYDPIYEFDEKMCVPPKGSEAHDSYMRTFKQFHAEKRSAAIFMRGFEILFSTSLHPSDDFGMGLELGNIARDMISEHEKSKKKIFREFDLEFGNIDHDHKLIEGKLPPAEKEPHKFKSQVIKDCVDGKLDDLIAMSCFDKEKGSEIKCSEDYQAIKDSAASGRYACLFTRERDRLDQILYSKLHDHYHHFANQYFLNVITDHSGIEQTSKDFFFLERNQDESPNRKNENRWYFRIHIKDHDGPNAIVDSLNKIGDDAATIAAQKILRRNSRDARSTRNKELILMDAPLPGKSNVGKATSIEKPKQGELRDMLHSTFDFNGQNMARENKESIFGASNKRRIYVKTNKSFPQDHFKALKNKISGFVRSHFPAKYFRDPEIGLLKSCMDGKVPDEKYGTTETCDDHKANYTELESEALAQFYAYSFNGVSQHYSQGIKGAHAEPVNQEGGRPQLYSLLGSRGQYFQALYEASYALSVAYKKLDTHSKNIITCGLAENSNFTNSNSRPSSVGEGSVLTNAVANRANGRFGRDSDNSTGTIESASLEGQDQNLLNSAGGTRSDLSSVWNRDLQSGGGGGSRSGGQSPSLTASGKNKTNNANSNRATANRNRGSNGKYARRRGRNQAGNKKSSSSDNFFSASGSDSPSGGVNWAGHNASPEDLNQYQKDAQRRASNNSNGLFQIITNRYHMSAYNYLNAKNKSRKERNPASGFYYKHSNY